MRLIDGGYLTWVYGSQVWGYNSWNIARLKYVDDIWLMDSPNLIRTKEYPQYKEHRREKAKKDPQMAERKERVHEFRQVIYSDPSIRTLEIPGLEVDDLVGLLILMAGLPSVGLDLPVEVVGIDKDMLQYSPRALLSSTKGDRVDVGKFRGRLPKTIAPYVEGPKEVLLSLALLGDTSDDVPRLIPPRRLDMAVEIMSSEEPFLLGYEYFQDLFIQNIWLTVLPGPFCFGIGMEYRLLELLEDESYFQLEIDPMMKSDIERYFMTDPNEVERRILDELGF